MSTTEPAFPSVEIAVCVIRRGEQVLLVFNDGWGAFTFPMSKRRHIPDFSTESGFQSEAALDAAIRAAAETLGRPLSEDHLPKAVPAETQPYAISAREGGWKRYEYSLFVLEVGEDETPRDPHCWLTPEDLDSHRPISSTVGNIWPSIAASLR